MPKSQFHPHARAAINFKGSLFAHIYLSPEADSSSLVHEGGHLFLEMYTDAAGRKGATPALLADYGIMLDWFELSDAQWRAMPLSDREPYHELFAEAFTLYVATRHSPAEGAHRAFGDWLSATHLELQPHRPTPPGASIQALFDRLTMVTSPEWPLEAGAGVAETIQKAAEEAGLSPWVARTQGALYGSAFQRLYENQGESLEAFLGRYQLSVSSASGALPVKKPSTMLYQIAGPHSETANLELLEEARERLAAADQAEKAFRETGWYLGIDGQWRYEISDHLVQPLAPFDQPELPFGEGYASVQAARLSGGALGVRLKDVIHHDALFAAYPELAGVSVTVIPGRSSHFKLASSLDPAAFHIGSSLSSTEGIDSLLHEVQHWIQTIERFAPGSSFEREREDYEGSEKHFDALIGRLRGLEASIKDEALIKEETDPLWRAQALAWAQQQPGIRTLDTQGQAIVYAQQQNPEYLNLFSEYMALVSGPLPLTPIDRYRRAAGEVEARNTVSRRAMDAAERRDVPPWLTQDTPDSAQLVSQHGMHRRIDDHTGATTSPVSGTESPAFQRWFDKSRVVDERGEPLVVYHGTNANFSEFNPSLRGLTSGDDASKSAFWFTNAKIASEYADFARDQEFERESPSHRYTTLAELGEENRHNPGRGQNVMPVYLAMQNPVEIDVAGKNYQDARRYVEEALAQAKVGGNDGIIVRNYDDDPSGNNPPTDHFAVLDPKQIKSAIGNTGTFDPSKPDIRFSMRPALQAQIETPPSPLPETETPAFQRWFKDSKVVDKENKPLVVYHGAKKGGFTVFNTDGRGKTAGTGAFFTESMIGASTYSGVRNEIPLSSFDDELAKVDAGKEALIEIVQEDDGEWCGVLPDGSMHYADSREDLIDILREDYASTIEPEAGNYPVYLSLQNPMVIDAEGKNWDSIGAYPEYFVQDENGETVEYFLDESEANSWAADNEEEYGPLEVIEEENNLDAASTDDLARQARELGYDGVIFDNVTDEGPSGSGYNWDNRIFVAFSPEQIKSATSNTGAFDPANPDILYSMRPARKPLTESPAFKQWFGESVVASADGAPLVVFHGSAAYRTPNREGIIAFDPNRRGSRTDSNSAEMGFFFSDDPMVADSYNMADVLHSPLGGISQRRQLAETYLDMLYEEAVSAEAEWDEEEGAYLLQISDVDPQFGSEFTYYHGDSEGYDLFDTEEDALAAWEDEKSRLIEVAEKDWADAEAAYVKHTEEEYLRLGATVYPVYLKMEAPFVHDFDGGDFRDQSFSELLEQARIEGCDGVIMHNVSDSYGGPGEPSTVYVVFDSTQIKSAIGNDGSYDRENADMRFSQAVNPEKDSMHTSESLRAAVAAVSGRSSQALLESGLVRITQSQDVPAEVYQTAAHYARNAEDFDPANQNIHFSIQDRASDNHETLLPVAYQSNDNFSLIADHIPIDHNIKGLLLHEVGVHALRLGRDDRTFRGILNRLEALRVTDVRVQAAYHKVPPGTPKAMVSEEALGYLVEAHPDMPLAKRFVAWLKSRVRGIAKCFKSVSRLAMVQWASELSAEDMIYMASQAVRRYRHNDHHDRLKDVGMPAFSMRAVEEAQKPIPVPAMNEAEEAPDISFLYDLMPAGGAESLSNNDIVNIIATAHSHGDRTLYATMKKLYLSAPRVREVAKQEFSYLSPFFTDSGYAPLASMAINASDRLGAKSLQTALLEERGGDLTGLVLENRSGDRWALFLPDASEPGRYRYSEFSPNGPMSHSTRNSYVELLAEAIDAGYRQPVDPQVLEDITHTPAFEHGAAISILIDQLNYGHISHDEYIEQTAKLSPVPDDTPQIASPDFQRRFTGSQVVDSSGNPLLVYHGTNAVFEDFQIGRSGGIYFTSNIHYASSYGRNIMPAYVNLKNPLDVVHNKAHRELAIDLFNNMGGWEDNEDVMSERESPFYDPAMDSLWEILDDPDVSDEIRALGYDGFIGDEASPGDPPIVSYVAFSPEQITVANDSLVRQQVRARLTGDSAEQATVKSAFKRWFGASKAIDEGSGNPLKLMVAPEQASSDSLAGQLLHAQDGYSRRIADPLHPTVKADASVYLRATNPYITDALNELDEHAMSDLKDNLLAQGYDAIASSDRRSWIALESDTQIKSAIANAGEYSLHDADIRFRLGDVIMHAADPVRYRQAETLLSNLTRRWPPEALDRVTLVDRFEDLDPHTREAILALGGNPFTRGCALDGHCYIIARNHTYLLDLESTLFHEAYGHLGFSALFGSKLTRKMADLHSAVGGDEGLIELSRRYGINLTAAGERFAALVDSGDITQDQRNAYMMEELLAHMQEDQRPTLARRAKETWGMIRSWFRANSSHLARATDADLFYTLKCARRAFVELGKDQHARGSITSPGMLNGSATWYRSALADTIPAMATIADKDGKVCSDQALSWLRSQQKRGAFRKDELTWSGLEEWLLLNDGKVLVDDVQGYINNNAIKVNTVTYGNAFHHLQKVCNEAGYEIETTAEEVVFIDNDGDICEFDDLPDNIKQAINNDDTPRSNARYPQYQTLPSHRYREVLITLDDTCLTTGSFEHAHWDAPNVLAHVRLAETEKDGRRTLFVEEIQSDWGQTAQAFGLRGEAIQYGTKVHGYTPEGYHWQKDVRPDVSYVVHQLVNTKNGEVVAEGSDRIEALLKSGLEKTQPSAPFIDATEKWVTLALKRVIAIAADEGFDEVALVNGDQCARTLSVSKHLSRIDIERMATDNQSYQMDAYDNTGTQVISNQVIDQKMLADYLGKNLAQTIVSQKGGKHSYTDLDMMIGGNGLKTFYDKIVPSVLSRLLKKLGGPAMTSRPAVPGDSSNNVRFDITDSLRRHASHGLPLFRAADRYPVSSLSDIDLSDVELLNSDPHHQHRVQMS